MEGPEADSGHLGVPQMDGGLGRGILEEELDETDLFIYEDDGSSIATGIGSDDRTNVSEKRGEKDFFLTTRESFMQNDLQIKCSIT